MINNAWKIATTSSVLCTSERSR